MKFRYSIDKYIAEVYSIKNPYTGSNYDFVRHNHYEKSLALVQLIAQYAYTQQMSYLDTDIARHLFNISNAAFHPELVECMPRHPDIINETLELISVHKKCVDVVESILPYGFDVSEHYVDFVQNHSTETDLPILDVFGL